MLTTVLASVFILFVQAASGTPLPIAEYSTLDDCMVAMRQAQESFRNDYNGHRIYTSCMEISGAEIVLTRK